MVDIISIVMGAGKRSDALMTERRRYRRYRFARKVIYAFSDNPRKRIRTKSINISQGGIQIVIDKFVEGTKKIKLYIYGPHALRPITISGKITWQARFTDLAESRAGIEFADTEINRDSARIIRLMEETV